jgi:MHS family metabolite:H+ symporter-like MFS transporter
MTGSWWPIVAMLVAYSVIGLVSAILMPEVRDRDLSLAEDAAEAPRHGSVGYGALSSRR